MQVYEWLFSSQAQHSMTALAKVCAALFGTSSYVNGLSCGPTSPATMTVQVGAGEIYQMEPLEATTCGTLPANTTNTILKQGIQLGTYTTATFATPGTSGQSINYLIEAQYQDSDISLDPTTGTSPVVLQFYNSTNPSTPWSGPNNSGATSNTYRDGVVAYQIKAGAAATTGTQTTPSPDTGWVGLWVVTVPFGASSLTSANISPYNGSPVLASPILTQVQQSPSVVGTVRNLSMSVTAASATASLTADEIVVESALGGNTYKLASFSKTINLATTGAGGMDTGSAPASGFVALYAIYNPTTQTAALLATNATSAVAPNVYGGANMPSGYTASGLVSVWPTNASSQFPMGIQIDRFHSFVTTSVLNTTSTVTTPASLSIANAVPKNARTWSGYGLSSNNTANQGSVLAVYASSTQIGLREISATSAIANSGIIATFENVPILTPQTTYYVSYPTPSGTSNGQLNITGYTI